MGEDVLSPQQDRAITLALGGKKDGEIARAIGTSRQTVNRWRNQDEAFRTALAMRRETLREETADALQALSTKAIRVLAEAMESENEYVRLRAAALVLKACETRTKMAREKGVDRMEIERQIVIATLTEALTDMGRGG